MQHNLSLDKIAVVYRGKQQKNCSPFLLFISLIVLYSSVQLDLIFLQKGDIVKAEGDEVAADANCSDVPDTEDEAVAEQEEESQSFAQNDWLPAVPISQNTFLATPTYVDDDCFIYLHDTEKSKFMKSYPPNRP
jgi:hypothetical protein